MAFRDSTLYNEAPPEAQSYSSRIAADCTGSAPIFFPGAPFPIETAFVIVESGKEVKEIVMTLQPNLATAVGRRVR